MASFKRKVAQAQLSSNSSYPRKRFKTLSDYQELMVLGQVPIMSLPVVSKRIPDGGLVNCLRQIVNSGEKTQKQIAKECSLSQTKMSQFMNSNTRTKGWNAVECRITYWLEHFTNQIPERNLAGGHFENKLEQLDPDNDCVFTVSRVQNCYNPTMWIQRCSTTLDESTLNHNQQHDCEQNPFPDVSLDFIPVEPENECFVSELKLEIDSQCEELLLWWEFSLELPNCLP